MLDHNQDAFSAKVAIVSFGCAKNLVDSEVMLGVLAERGYEPVQDPKLADLIVVNTCGFLQSAVEEAIEKILELAQNKENGKCKKLIVAGCMVERYRAELAKELPEVDAFLSTDELMQVGLDFITTDKCFDNARRPLYLYDEKTPRMISTGSHLAYVKIADGCDRPCAFCIIPKLRGSYRSRKLESVVTEVKSLFSKGTKEIDLIAQDLTNYGKDLNDDTTLVNLLKRLRAEKLPLDSWVRLMYSYPAGITEELILLIKETPFVCDYLDLPLQHISDRILKNMHRPLGEKRTRQLIADIRKWHPQLVMRTTFIVGFPGETKEDIEMLEGFIREGWFEHVGIFAYSQEEEAKSFNYPEQVSLNEAEERRNYLLGIQQQLVGEKLRQRVGKRERVLIEGWHPETELLLVGRTEWQAPEVDGQVIVNEVLGADSKKSVESKIGSFAEVEFTDTKGYDLIGRIL